MLVTLLSLLGLAPESGVWKLCILESSVAFADEIGVAGPDRNAVDASFVGTSIPEYSKFGGRVDTRVELLWASEVPRRWAGSITWQDASDSSKGQSQSNEVLPTPVVGRLSIPNRTAPFLLGASPILSGGVFETSDGGLVFGPPARSPMIPSGEGKLSPVETRSGGISFRVQGRLDDRVTLRFDGDDVNAGHTVSFAIGDLIAGKAMDAMINDRASVSIRRVAAGDLRVRLGDSTTIFWAEQSVDIVLINPMALPIIKPTNTLVLECQTYSAADDSLISSVSFPVIATAGELHCPQGKWVSPATNGAYRVRLRLRDTSSDRGWLSTALNPSTMANSFTRSITTSLPQSLTTPLSIPLSSFNSLANGPDPQPQASKPSTSMSPPLPSEMSMRAMNWQLTHEPSAIAESVISVAVVGASGEMSISDQPADGVGLESEASVSKNEDWIQLGTAVVRDESSTVSRLFIQPTAQWFGSATNGKRTAATVMHAGQRLNLIESGQQLEMSIPISKVGIRHRAVIRMPSETSLRMVAELVDLDPLTGVPLPLGPGLAIVRNGQRKVASTANVESNRPSTAQASGIDSSGVDESEVWHEAIIDFWPRSPATRLVLSNRSTTTSAAVGRVDVMAVETSALPHPMVKQNRRSTGDVRLVAMRLEMCDFLEQFGDRGLPTTARPLDYQQVWVATDRLIETMRREGYGGLILTVSTDGTSFFPDRSIVPDTAWNANWAGESGPVDPLRLMLRRFEHESLRLIPCIRPSAPALALEQRIRSDPSSGSIVVRSPLAGQLGAWSFDGPQMTSFPLYNGENPEVFEQFAKSLLDLNERCGNRTCVPAIGVLVDERSYLRSSLSSNIDEQTLREFHANLGENAPPRETLEAWIQKTGASEFQRWQAKRLATGFQNILDKIEGRNLLILSCDSALPANLVELGGNRRIITTRLQRRALTEPLAMRVRDEACNASVPISMEGGKSPQAYLAAVFHQPTSDARGFEPGPHGKGGSASANNLHLDAMTLANVGDLSSQQGVSVLLDPTESSLAFANLVNRSDRSIVAIGGGAVNQPASDIRRRSLRTFAELPPVVMSDVESHDSASASLRVRMATFNEDTYIYAVNQTRWPVVWEAILSRPATVHRLGPTASQRALSQKLPESAPLQVAAPGQTPSEPNGVQHRPGEFGTRWQTLVDAGELVAIRISTREAKLIDWRAKFAGSATQVATIHAGVEDAVSAIKEKSHLRRRSLIANSSFEADGAGVPGWMIAQYPTDCVALDSSVAFQGARSIRLTGQAGRAGGSWLISQPIATPRSGRLAVSIRFRGGLAENKSKRLGEKGSKNNDNYEPLVVRMALEGTVGGTPIRKTRSVTLERDGNWGEPQWLEIVRLPSLPVESLRLTIDLMSAGEVWVDDIACYDQFMTAAEVTQWEHLVFLAAGGLSRGDCIGASRLFESHWALDLVNSSPIGNGQPSGTSPVRRAAFNPSVSSESTNSSVVSPAPEEQKSPPKIKQPAPRTGWTDQLKSWIPRPLRFGS